MIARHEATAEKIDIWAQLSAPLPTGVIAWRQDGRAIQRDGKFFARFVAYVDANTVRERLDSVVAGEWDLTLELLPTLVSDEQDEPTCSFKARLQILGVIREDVGTGRFRKLRAAIRLRCPIPAPVEGEPSDDELLLYLDDLMPEEEREEFERRLAASPHSAARIEILQSALVECGFLTSASERRLLTTGVYQDRIALAIADGIVAALILTCFLKETGPAARKT